MTKKKDPNLTTEEALKKAWKSRKDYKGYDKSRGSMYNSWRSKVYTKKGKEAGFPDKWKKFDGFKEDVGEGWERGLILMREDTDKPYSKENCFWAEKGSENMHKLKAKVEYKGEVKFLHEWSEEFDMPLAGIRQRYHRGKNYTPEEIIFGKKIVRRRKIKDHTELNGEKEVRLKASKMINQYKLKDRKKGLDYDIDIGFMLDAFEKSCVYCGMSEKIGLDRKDNSLGHTKKNCVPCCYRCNVTRGDQFSYEEMKTLGETIKKIDDDRKKED